MRRSHHSGTISPASRLGYGKFTSGVWICHCLLPCAFGGTRSSSVSIQREPHASSCDPDWHSVRKLALLFVRRRTISIRGLAARLGPSCLGLQRRCKVCLTETIMLLPYQKVGVWRHTTSRQMAVRPKTAQGDSTWICRIGGENVQEVSPSSDESVLGSYAQPLRPLLRKDQSSCRFAAIWSSLELAAYIRDLICYKAVKGEVKGNELRDYL